MFEAESVLCRRSTGQALEVLRVSVLGLVLLGAFLTFSQSASRTRREFLQPRTFPYNTFLRRVTLDQREEVHLFAVNWHWRVRKPHSVTKPWPQERHREKREGLETTQRLAAREGRHS